MRTYLHPGLSSNYVPEAWQIAVQTHLNSLTQAQREAFKVASDHLETLEKLAVILQRIVASLERYNNYEILFKDNLTTQRAIGALYGDLIDLCARVVRFHSRPSLSAIFVSFDKEFQQLSENIAHHSTEIDWAANAANIDEAKKARGFEDATRQGQIRADVQRWLSPAEVQDDLYRHEGDCMSGSCDWAFETPELQAFLASGNSEILRIGGAPGSGKSTLAAFIIRRLTQSITGDVLYFFCKGTDEKKKHPFQILRTLISQLLARDCSLYPWFETLYEQSGQKTASSFASLHHSFQLALSNTLKPLIYIVVDALDECQQAKDLVLSMITMSKESKGIVKIILTSREDPELLDYFDRPVNELIISQNDVRGLVWKYVEERVAKCKQICGTNIGVRVHAKVAVAAAGLWLYARLMMDEIQRLPSPASIERQLQSIPDGLAELYRQIFATMEESLSPLQLSLSQQVFLWVDMSEFVQIGRDFLDRELLDIVIQAGNSGEEVFDCFDLARQLCSPLIELYEVDDGRLEVRFVHHTAAQFVRQCSKESTLKVPRILKPQQLKALHRGNTGVWYFEESLKSTLILQRLRSDPHSGEVGEYLEMAYGLWDAFFLRELPESLDSDGIAQASRLCDKLTAFLMSGRCLRWVEIAIIFNYAGNWTKLLDNAIEALEAAEVGIASSFHPFQLYSAIRKQFFTDYVYVLSLTGPRDGWWEGPPEMPEGFQTRPLAAELLSLGHHWAPLCHEKITLVHLFRGGHGRESPR
ncbi:hypothetical protein GP486_006963 [Trichoglossum hirsutum]|uniref:NACHT domain-containing protein n=1 Tax=Trichoglossum hirsutum TaxID=265104 RepID=A0A9P8L745_9PEZI|nr:hypothetical protein GP486_006963 [Trichoglossum hirsutum]